MSNNKYASIFQPLNICGVKVKNRVCIPPMAYYGFADDSGNITDAHIAHYQSFAEGGAGLLIQEATCVSPEGRFSHDQLGIWNDEHVAGLKRLTNVVHRAGGVIFIQLHHAGLMSIDEPHLCPDNFSFERNGTVKNPTVMTFYDIERVQNAFVDAAIRAYHAGYDGIELHACHRYLMCQFLNSHINNRYDRYGQTPELFLMEILVKIKEKLPHGYPIGFRIGAFEPNLEDGIRHAIMLEKSGASYFSVSYGFSGQDNPFSPDEYPYDAVVYAAGEFKKALSVPIFAANGINSPLEVETIIKSGTADMCCVGRSSLIDNAWTNHVKNDEKCGKCLHCKFCMYEDALLRNKCPGKNMYKR